MITIIGRGPGAALLAVHEDAAAAPQGLAENKL